MSMGQIYIIQVNERTELEGQGRINETELKRSDALTTQPLITAPSSTSVNFLNNESGKAEMLLTLKNFNLQG